MLVLQFNEGTNPPSITLYHRFAYSNDCNNSCVRDTPILHFLTVLKRGCFGGVLARRLITNFLPRQTVKHPLCLSRPSWAPRCLPSYNLGGAAHASCIIMPRQIPRIKYKYKIPTNTNVKTIQFNVWPYARNISIFNWDTRGRHKHKSNFKQIQVATVLQFRRNYISDASPLHSIVDRGPN